MKELKVFESWADNVIEASTQFKQPTRMGTPMNSKADRPLPRNIDIQYKAQRAHPELSPEQALAMYMSDELVDKEKMDLSQNKVINTVKSDNEKLRRTIDELGKELHAHEKQADQTDQEVARLKDLSAKLKPAGELTKQVAQATTQQIEKMLKDVDDLRMKPGMTPEKQKELEDKINSVKAGGLTSDEVNNINHSIEFLSAKQEIDDVMFDKVMHKLQDTQTKLATKEKRFQTSISNNAEKIQKWGNKFSDLDKKVSDIEKRADDKLAQIEKASEEADETLDRIAQMVRQMNPSVAQPAVQALSSLDDRDEAHQAMAAPSSTTIPSTASDAEEDDFDVATLDDPEEDDEDYASVADLLNKYRKPTNVKKLGEQIEMQEPPDEVETVIIPKLVRRYKYMYPTDFNKWSEGQLKEILRRTVDRRLLIWAPDIDEKRIKNYLEACHNWLRKLRPVQPELPGMPEEPAQQLASKRDTFRPDYEWPPRADRLSESLVSDFEQGLTKLTNGY